MIKMDLKQGDFIKITSLYDLGNLISVKPITKGFQNYLFVLKTTKRKYVLRIGKKTKKKKDILFEVNLLNSLTKFPVPKYVRDIKGNFVNTYNGHFYTISRYIPGETPKKTNMVLFRKIALFLADFHNKTNGFDINVDRFSWYTLPKQRVEKYKKYILQKLPEYIHDVEYMEKELEKNQLPQFIRKGPIHCDVKRENIICIGNKLTGVVDFDNYQIGPYLLDLAIAIIWFCTSKNGPDYKKIHLFLKYYGERRKLTDDEVKCLFKAIKYAYVSHEFIDYYVYSKGIITKDYFDFGRSFFLPAAKKMNEKKFEKTVLSKFANI